jgi:hypothetical protein
MHSMQQAAEQNQSQCMHTCHRHAVQPACSRRLCMVASLFGLMRGPCMPCIAGLRALHAHGVGVLELRHLPGRLTQLRRLALLVLSLEGRSLCSSGRTGGSSSSHSTQSSSSVVAQTLYEASDVMSGMLGSSCSILLQGCALLRSRQCCNSPLCYSISKVSELHLILERHTHGLQYCTSACKGASPRSTVQQYLYICYLNLGWHPAPFAPALIPR